MSTVDNDGKRKYDGFLSAIPKVISMFFLIKIYGGSTLGSFLPFLHFSGTTLHRTKN